jgi:hypothetical protein
MDPVRTLAWKYTRWPHIKRPPEPTAACPLHPASSNDNDNNNNNNNNIIIIIIIIY